MLLAYDTERRLQEQGLAREWTLQGWEVEAGPAYFDETVIGVKRAISEAATRAASRKVPLPRWLGFDITHGGDWRSCFPRRPPCCLVGCSSDSSWMPRCPSSSASSWSGRSTPRSSIGCSRAPRPASTPVSC